jgi:hypothetical protein
MATTSVQSSYVTDSEKETYIQVAMATLTTEAMDSLPEVEESLGVFADVGGYLRFRIQNDHLKEHMPMRYPELDERVCSIWGLKTSGVMEWIYLAAQEALVNTNNLREGGGFNAVEAVKDIIASMQAEDVPLALHEIQALALSIVLTSDDRESFREWVNVREYLTIDDLRERQGFSTGVIEELNTEFKASTPEAEIEPGAEFETPETRPESEFGKGSMA